MKYNSDSSTWLPNQVEKLCTDIAVSYGKVYLDQLDERLTSQIKKYLGRPASLGEFENMVSVQHSAVPTNIKKRPMNCFSTFLWNNYPLLEVEFSDYFYIKDLPLPKSTNKDIVT